MGALIQTNVVIEDALLVQSIIDHDSFIGYGTMLICSSCEIILSRLRNSKIESETIITRDDLPSSEDFIKSKGF